MGWEGLMHARTRDACSCLLALPLILLTPIHFQPHTHTLSRFPFLVFGDLVEDGGTLVDYVLESELELLLILSLPADQLDSPHLPTGKGASCQMVYDYESKGKE
jgi:hypothetical protein